MPQRIAIVRSLPGLGDFLCAVPAFRALRSALPDAHITLIGLPQASSWVHRFSHYLDEWLEFPGWVGIPEVPCLPQRSVTFLAHAQSLQFDLALQMHGNGSAINSFALLLGAAQTAGFFPAGHYCPHPDRFLPYPEDEPEIWRHLRLLEFLGIPAQGDQLEFPIWQSDWDELEAIASKRLLTRGDYVCIHPGASTGDRRWSPQHFAAVADALAAEGLQIVLTGTEAEANITQAVAEAMQFPAVDLTGQTSLGAIAALLKRARLLICNDTGISHLAAALRVKSIVIFSNSDPQRWAPLDRQRHRAIGITSPTHQSNDMLRWWSGETESVAVVMQDSTQQSLTSEDVVTEAIDLLQQEFAYVS
ncbi:MAG TPA: glycosyltransferase family 9 protein [Crinalium sp.]